MAVWGLMAEYENAGDLMRAAEQVRDGLASALPPDAGTVSLSLFALWVERGAELATRLAAAGFATVQRTRPDPRLDLWVCEG